MADTISRPTAAASRRPVAVALTVLVAAVGAVIAVVVVALIAQALGAPANFRQLQPATYIPLVIIGVLAGAVGWEVTARRARDPRRTLARLVPAVLLLSFIPDVLLGVSGSAWSGVAALMVMHLAVAAVALPVYARLLPVSPHA